MVLKIGNKVAPIEIEVNGIEFSVSKADETLKKIETVSKRIVEEQRKITKDEDGYRKLREVCIEGYDVMLGDGAFDKIEKSLSDDGGEYTVVMCGYFFEIFSHILEEVNSMADVSRYTKHA